MKIASLKKYHVLLLAVITTIICSLPTGAFAAGPPVPSEMSNTLAQMLVVIIAALLLVIVMLANVLIGAAEIFTQRFKEAKKNGTSGDAVKVFICFIVLPDRIFCFCRRCARCSSTCCFFSCRIWWFICYLILYIDISDWY